MSETPLKRISREKLDPEFALAWDTLDGLTGEPAFVEAFASAPELLRFVMNDFYAKIFFAGRLENKYKQLARLYLSMTHGCRTCNKQNIPGSRDAGITDNQIATITEFESGPFDNAERAVLRFASQMALTNADGVMTADLHRDLSQHFDDAQICELGTVMAVIGGMAKLAFVLDLVEKEPYCEFARPAA
jgi:alkylhydroperoxidase family enzyme